MIPTYISLGQHVDVHDSDRAFCLLVFANVYYFCKLFSNTLFFIICFVRQFFMLSSMGFSCCRICVFLCGGVVVLVVCVIRLVGVS